MKASEHIAVNAKGIRWLWQRERRAMLLMTACSPFPQEVLRFLGLVPESSL